MRTLKRLVFANVLAIAAGTAAVVAYMKDEKFKASTDKTLNDIKDTAVKVGNDLKEITKDYINQIKDEIKAAKEEAEETEEVQEEVNEIPEEDHIDTL